jgi:hypothetical protein
MSSDKYKAFLTHLFKEHVEQHLSVLGLEEKHMLEHVMREAQQGLQVTDYIVRFCRTDEEIYETFTSTMLHNTVAHANNTLLESRSMLDESGYLAAVDDYFDEIVEGLDPDLLPPAEVQLLAGLGRRDPKEELTAVIYLVQARREHLHSKTVRQQFEEGIEVLRFGLPASDGSAGDKGGRSSGPGGKRPRKGRRWFKGVGQILQGGVLAIGDVALATGWLHLPVDAQTRTWGSVVSVATGVGLVCNGIGELRGE